MPGQVSSQKIKKNSFSIYGFMGGLIVFFIVLIFGHLGDGHPQTTYTLAIALLMAIWWVTETIPLAVTALIPVILFPLLGIMDGKDISSTYFNHVIFLFIGGFLIALAMERWNLHKRLALKILMYTGVSPGRILLGFMISTAFLSMWISNTATTMMMIPILISIIIQLEESVGKKNISRYSIGLLLGVAYSASIGGIATLVGTPPNLSFTRIFSIFFPEAPEITFATWFFYAFPVSVVFFIIVWTYLYFVFKPRKDGLWNIEKLGLKEEYIKLGKAKYEEKIVFIIFVLMALFLLFRSNITIGNFTIPGWSNIFPDPSFINDGTIAIFFSVILFAVPSKTAGTKKIMNWSTASRIPWNIVLLFGGGFALATGFKESGLSLWFGDQLKWVITFHPLIIIAFIVFFMTFLTELTSNTATTEMILPILAGLSINTEINPLLFMLPATLAGSMAFMLPVATPPNAIVFGTNRLLVKDMAKNGLILNIIGIGVITLATYFLGMYIFDIDLSVFPEWARP